MEIGSRIRERRLALGLSQTELARRVGVRAPSVCEWEAGSTTPTMPNLRKVAAELQTTMAQLLGEESLPPVAAEPESESAAESKAS